MSSLNLGLFSQVLVCLSSFLKCWVCRFQAQHQKRKLQPYVDCLTTCHSCLVSNPYGGSASPTEQQSRIWCQKWGVFVTYCCVTKHPNVYQLKTVEIISLLTLLAVGWAFRKHSVEWFWFGSRFQISAHGFLKALLVPYTTLSQSR